jgi:hypothetical protein
MQDIVKVEGTINLKLFERKGGPLIGEWNIPNVVTIVGKAAIAGLLLADVGGIAFDYIAIGTGTTPASQNDTALQAEITTGGGQRRGGADVVGIRVTTSYPNDTAKLTTTFTFTSSFAVTEYGVFNATSGGTLLCRRVYSPVNVVSGNILQVEWKIKFS